MHCIDSELSWAAIILTSISLGSWFESGSKVLFKKMTKAVYFKWNKSSKRKCSKKRLEKHDRAISNTAWLFDYILVWLQFIWWNEIKNQPVTDLQDWTSSRLFARAITWRWPTQRVCVSCSIRLRHRPFLMHRRCVCHLVTRTCFPCHMFVFISVFNFKCSWYIFFVFQLLIIIVDRIRR